MRRPQRGFAAARSTVLTGFSGMMKRGRGLLGKLLRKKSGGACGKPVPKRKPFVQTLDIDVFELAVRMAENASGRRRPDEMSPKEILDTMGEDARGVWVSSAHTAALYFVEILGGGGRPN